METASKFIFNHFHDTKSLGTKDELVKNLKRYYEGEAATKESNYQVFDSIPFSIVIGRESMEGV